MPQACAEGFVRHYFAQFGLIFKTDLERRIFRVEGAARTPDQGVALPDRGELQEDERRDDQQDAHDDDFDVARHHDEGRVADERHGQRAARARNQHAVAGRGGDQQQVYLHPRIAVIERRDRKDDHRKSHRAAEVGGVAEEREIPDPAVDDVRRASAENEQPVVFGGVEAEELLDAGFAHGDQRQTGDVHAVVNCCAPTIIQT